MSNSKPRRAKERRDDEGRRASGDGSVYQRKDGRWVAVLQWSGPDGKRQRVSRYARTELAAWKLLDGLIKDREKGNLGKAERQTVAQYLQHWLQTIHCVPQIATATAIRDEQAVRLHIVPALGKVILQELRPTHVQELIEAMRAKKRSARTIQHAHAVLRKALSDAERLELVSRNVAKVVPGPTVARPVPSAMPAETAQQILAAVAEDRLGTLFVVLLTCGLRLGEVLGLRWDCVDLDNRQLEVRWAFQRLKGQTYLKVPKSTTSQRSVPLPALTVAAFREHRRQQVAEQLWAGPDWLDTGLVFVDEQGDWLSPDVVRGTFYRLLAAAKVDRVRLHDLRHAYATLLLARGESLKTIQTLLGHSSSWITADIYTGVLPTLHRQAADQLDDLLGTRTEASKETAKNGA